MYVLKLQNIFGEVVYSSTMDNLSHIHEEALQKGWNGAKVTILEGLQEADGEIHDLELVYEYYLNLEDYGKSTDSPYGGLEKGW